LDGALVHNVVLTSLKDSNDAFVTYHDPDKADGEDQEMIEAEFLSRWRDARTDNDLLIISRDHLDIG